MRSVTRSRGDQLIELRLVDYPYAEGPSLRELCPCFFAGDKIVGFLGNSAGSGSAILADECFNFIAFIFLQRAGDDKRFAGKWTSRCRYSLRLLRLSHSDTGVSQLADCLLAVCAVQEFVDALRDHRAHIFRIAQVLLRCGNEFVHRSKVLRDRTGNARANMPNAERVEQSREPACLA